MRPALPPSLLLALLAPVAAHSQSAPPPRFKVASVKPAGDNFSTRPQRSPGRLTWTAELDYLIGYAYDLDPCRVSVPEPGDTSPKVRWR